MSRAAEVALVLASFVNSAFAAQSPRYPLNVAGATFVEQVHSEVKAQSGLAERNRTIVRSATYTTTMRADTLVVTADSLRLDETADNTRNGVDVDAVIGGRWKLIAGAPGPFIVVETPFVPGFVADVSDLSSAMDDFFPIAPPLLGPGARSADGSPRAWRRLADSARAQRYRWTEQRHSDSTSVGADSVAVHAVVDTHEDGAIAWSGARGPLAWTRHIQTTVVSRFAGRTVRAIVDQRIVVARTG